MVVSFRFLYSIKSAMVPILRSCFSANFSSSGRRAIEPSSFKISTITPAGSNPAKRGKSTPASVCPARFNTPPSLAISGKICPGCTISVAFASLATAALIVTARSAAEIPVVTPVAASIDTVKLVENCASFLSTINGRLRRLQRASVIGRQTKPLACVTIKLMASGVTCSAAIIRSPSFSRSSSSIKITILP